MLSRKVFADAMQGLSEMFGKPMSKMLLDIYYETLKGLTDEQFKSACVHIAGTRKYAGLPKPAEFIQFISGDPEDAALSAYHKATKAARSIGGYQTVVFDDPIIHGVVSTYHEGWTGFCQLLDGEMKYEEARFIRTYKALANRTGSSFPNKLAGIEEHQNTLAGHNPPTPVMIGDNEGCKKVLGGDTNVELPPGVGGVLGAIGKDIDNDL